MWCCDHLEWSHDWAQLRHLYQLLRFWQAGAELYLSCGLPVTSLVYTFPFTPATYPSGVACLSCLPLPSVYEASLQSNTDRKETQESRLARPPPTSMCLDLVSRPTCVSGLSGASWCLTRLHWAPKPESEYAPGLSVCSFSCSGPQKECE